MCDATDIDKHGTKIELPSNLVRSPLSSVTKSFQRLHIGQDAPPVRNRRRRVHFREETVAARKRRQKPRSRLSLQNPERRLHTERILQIVPRLVRHDVISFFASHFEKALDN